MATDTKYNKHIDKISIVPTSVGLASNIWIARALLIYVGLAQAHDTWAILDLGINLGLIYIHLSPFL